MSRYIGVQGRRGSLALAPWKSKLLLGSKVIVPPVISIVTQHKRFLLERKMGNSWKVSPLAIQLLHTHTHIYKKITIIHTYSYLNELFIYICDICDISHTSRKGENSNTNSKSPQQFYNDFRQTKPSVKPSYTTFYRTQV